MNSYFKSFPKRKCLAMMTSLVNLSVKEGKNPPTEHKVFQVILKGENILMIS
jgi:hypothetical protein